MQNPILDDSPTLSVTIVSDNRALELVGLSTMAYSVGNFVAQRRYFHVSAIGSLDALSSELVFRASVIANARPEIDYNVVRIDSLDESVALLNYPGFFDEACPALARSWKVSVQDQACHPSKLSGLVQSSDSCS